MTVIKDREKFLQSFSEHLGEMTDGDTVLIRKGEGKFIVCTFSGAYTVCSVSENIEEAWSEEQ